MFRSRTLITALCGRSNLLLFSSKPSYGHYSRQVSTLTPQKITEILSRNEINLQQNLLPSYIKSVECNQLASNSPIEDRLRVATIQLPNSTEPTLLLGVFDGHGGGTTVDLISRRLFNYIALSLHPDPKQLQISNKNGNLQTIVKDLHNAPNIQFNEPSIQAAELRGLSNFREDLSSRPSDIIAKLKFSFQRCDDDLAREIQENLTNSNISKDLLHHYLAATVSGCCAIVLVIHDGVAYVASSGDCRAVFGSHERTSENSRETSSRAFRAIELNDEHNCDNINEIRRLATQHPKSEQNTMIKHNRLLGHLMPFRAFGDFNYKWPVDVINACGITRVFGAGVIPSSYLTPPYLITEPDVKAVNVFDNDPKYNINKEKEQRYLVMASDGLWELFESSRDVVETIVEHAHNTFVEGKQDDDYDRNCATYILRSALRFGPHQDIGMDLDRLRKLYHIRLESTLTLPSSVVRNFRDDISIILLRLQ